MSLRDQTLLRRYRAGQRHCRGARVRGFLDLKPANLAGANRREGDPRAADLPRAWLAGAHYVDVTAGSREAAGDPALVAADGPHPSARVDEAWAHRVLPTAPAALDGGTS